MPRVVGSKVFEPAITDDEQAEYKLSIDGRSYLMKIMTPSAVAGYPGSLEPMAQFTYRF